MNTDNFTEILDWDTHFFGRKIAKIVVGGPDEGYVEEKLQEYKLLDFDLVYVFLPGSVKLSDRLCTSYHCKLVDCKMVYRAAIGGEYEVAPSIMEFQGEASELYTLGLQAGRDSRYRMDDYFAPDDFEKLYKTWIDNSVAGPMADKIFVFKEQLHHIEGFVTVKMQGDEAFIGLIAIEARQRGKGIGSRLIAAAKRYVKDSRITSLYVATQKQNVPACTFYERNGFILKSETNIYHAWLKHD